MPLLDARPPGVNLDFRPGNSVPVTVNWPAGYLSGRTHTATLDDVSLDLQVAGDVMTITLSEAQSAAQVGSGLFVITETTGGLDQDKLIGKWVPSQSAAASTSLEFTVEIVEGVVVNVTLAGGGGSDPTAVKLSGDQTIAGEKTFSDDMELGPASFPGDGTVAGGVIRQAHSIQVPWSYTQQDWVPSDPAVGTAFLVDWQSTIGTGTGTFGPESQTGLYGPRGVFQFEGLVRYARDMNAGGFAPVGYGDFVTIANNAGVVRDLAPSWGFLSARSTVADGAVCELVGTDVNDGGAAFVDSAVYGSVDSGQLDGTTNDYELVSYLSMPGLFGNVQIERRIAYDVMPAFEGIHPLVPEPTGPHWSGVGDFDPTTPTLTEEIGLRIQEFTLGTTKIGIQTAHPIHLLHVDQDIAGPFVAIDTPLDRTFTLRSAAQVKAFSFKPTLEFEDDASLFGPGVLFEAGPIIKNAASEAHTLGVVFGWISYNSAPFYRGDNAALTVHSHIGVRDSPTLDRVGTGTVSLPVTAFRSELTVGAGGTVTTRKTLDVADATGAGTVTTQVGVDVAALAKGGTNIGIRNASTEVATPSVATLAAVGNTITPNAKVKRLDNTSGGSLTLTSNPIISDGQDGQILILFNGSAQDVVLTDGQGLQLGAATRTLGQRDSIILLYSSTIGDWVELAFNGAN